MASKAWIARTRREPKYKTRKHNRCELCGRSRGYYRKFRICRICLRNLVARGQVPGVRKASW